MERVQVCVVLYPVRVLQPALKIIHRSIQIASSSIDTSSVVLRVLRLRIDPQGCFQELLCLVRLAKEM